MRYQQLLIQEKLKVLSHYLFYDKTLTVSIFVKW